MEKSTAERLLDIDITMAVYRCGIKDGEVTHLEDADFHNYRWSGCIEGDTAILEWKSYLWKKSGKEITELERREEALYHHMEQMVAEWYGRPDEEEKLRERHCINAWKGR